MQSKTRVEDALHAIRAAVEEGIIPRRRRRPAARLQGPRQRNPGREEEKATAVTPAAPGGMPRMDGF